MAQLVVTAITKVGTDITADLVAADALLTDQVKTSSGLLMVVDNADAAPKVVTIAAPVPNINCAGYGQLPLTDIVHNVAAGERVFFTVPTGYAVDGQFVWTYDDVTSVTVGVFSLAPEA